MWQKPTEEDEKNKKETVTQEKDRKRKEGEDTEDIYVKENQKVTIMPHRLGMLVIVGQA